MSASLAEWFKAVDLSSTIERCVSSNVSCLQKIEVIHTLNSFNSSQLAIELFLFYFCYAVANVGVLLIHSLFLVART